VSNKRMVIMRFHYQSKRQFDIVRLLNVRRHIVSGTINLFKKLNQVIVQEEEVNALSTLPRIAR